MSTEEQIPELVRLIFGEQAPTAYALGGEWLQAWAAAFDAWVSGAVSRNPRKTRNRHRRAWADFLASCHKAPWEVNRRDLQAWFDDQLRSSVAANTIRAKLYSLSSFYIYAQKVLDPALAVANPLKGFRKPSYKRYGHIVYLSAEDARRLLEAVDRETSLFGKRDYALLLAYLLLPGKPRDFLRLRWSGLTITEVGACLAGDPPIPLPIVIWEAIQDYLVASGRMDGIQPGDFVFAVAADPLHRTPAGSPDDWDPTHPVTAHLLRQALVNYCRAAGLRHDLVSLPGLRHTAVLLRLEAGAEPEEIASFLNLRQQYRVNLYLQRLVEIPKPELSIPGSDPQPVSRTRPLFESGNQAHLKHGLYATHLPAEDCQAVEEAPPDSLLDEIAAMRAVIRRTLNYLPEAGSLEAASRLLDVFGQAATRLSRLMLAHKDLQGKQDPVGQALEQALAEMAEELGITQ